MSREWDRAVHMWRHPVIFKLDNNQDCQPRPVPHLGVSACEGQACRWATDGFNLKHDHAGSFENAVDHAWVRCDKVTLDPVTSLVHGSPAIAACTGIPRTSRETDAACSHTGILSRGVCKAYALRHVPVVVVSLLVHNRLLSLVSGALYERWHRRSTHKHACSTRS